MVKNRKSEHHHWIPLIQISLGTKLYLKLIVLIFWQDLPKKGFSGLNQKKWTPHIFYKILHIHIILVWHFSSNWQFWIFGPNLPKKVSLVKNWKSEYHHWNSHIQIILGTKFPLKLTILIFLTRFAQKVFFWSKTEKVNPPYFLHNSDYSNKYRAKFQLKLKGISSRKQKKWTSTWNYAYLD